MWLGSCVFSAGGGGFTSYFYHSHARLVACCMAVNATGITWISSSEVWCTISPVACKSAEKGGGSDFFRGSALCAHTTFALVSDLVRLPPPLWSASGLNDVVFETTSSGGAQESTVPFLHADPQISSISPTGVRPLLLLNCCGLLLWVVVVCWCFVFVVGCVCVVCVRVCCVLTPWLQGEIANEPLRFMMSLAGQTSRWGRRHSSGTSHHIYIFCDVGRLVFALFLSFSSTLLTTRYPILDPY